MHENKPYQLSIADSACDIAIIALVFTLGESGNFGNHWMIVHALDVPLVRLLSPAWIFTASLLPASYRGAEIFFATWNASDRRDLNLLTTLVVGLMCLEGLWLFVIHSIQAEIKKRSGIGTESRARLRVGDILSDGEKHKRLNYVPKKTDNDATSDPDGGADGE